MRETCGGNRQSVRVTRWLAVSRRLISAAVLKARFVIAPVTLTRRTCRGAEQVEHVVPRRVGSFSKHRGQRRRARRGQRRRREVELRFGAPDGVRRVGSTERPRAGPSRASSRE